MNCPFRSPLASRLFLRHFTWLKKIGEENPEIAVFLRFSKPVTLSFRETNDGL